MTIAEEKTEAAFDVEALPFRFRRKIKVADNGCWIWTKAHSDLGYGHYWHNGRTVLAHRFSLAFFAGPSDLPVLHSCDTPACVNPRDLRYGTIADNHADMAERRRGVIPLGERSGRCKLTDQQVEEIRERRRSGELLGHLAREFGVSPTHVRDLCAGRFRVQGSGYLVAARAIKVD